METLLERLFYGKLNPSEMEAKDPEYHECIKYAHINKEKLLETLDDKEKIVFENFFEHTKTANDLSVINSFINGYKLGALLIIATLHE